MGDSDDEERRNISNKGWFKTEAYKPDKLKVFTPDKTVVIRPNDKAMLELLKVTLEDGTIVNEEKEDLRVWCCDDDPDIKGLSEGIKGRKLGEFLRIKCSPTWGYPEDRRQALGVSDDAVLVFWVWVKEVDPYLQHEPKCCTIL
eukprot:CAMPEP_0202688454 /NCGR_PEP_ID=MMETSP1385-20130828/3969_1 /ASSEMBLY_ACC=CAM_ASM_000861 /TAXON_ID=933848 /ORGANISM="Elphidium margaritaceum" /LENGTH=143 /DNA_ID=CAMNT_0049343441 /DNA_START=63 /DNA_END=494 /DNA_ORIENTATION=-